jgi:hypothetical protein
LTTVARLMNRGDEWVGEDIGLIFEKSHKDYVGGSSRMMAELGRRCRVAFRLHHRTQATYFGFGLHGEVALLHCIDPLTGWNHQGGIPAPMSSEGLSEARITATPSSAPRW